MERPIYDYIAADPTLSFLPPECTEVFEGCFNMHLHRLPPGARFETTGYVAYLLDGAGEIGAWDMESGAFFGVDSRGKPQRQTVTTHTSCLLLLWDDIIMSHLCYRGCWFHLRLLETIRRQAAGRIYRIGE